MCYCYIVYIYIYILTRHSMHAYVYTDTLDL